MNGFIKIIAVFMGTFGFFSCSQKIDFEKIYPFIITKDYIITGTKGKDVIVDTLEEGIYLSLVKDLDGLVEGIKLTDLKRNNISISQAFDIAQKNLDKILKEQKVKAALFDGPNGLPFIVFSDHWLSASSVFSSNLYSFASKNLNVDSIYVSIPQRDAMIIFPKCKGKELNDFKALIREKESDARKPLTFSIFELNIDGLKAIK